MKTAIFLFLILMCALPAAAQEFTIDGIKPAYALDDTLFFTMTNHTSEYLYFGGSPEYCIYNVLTGCQWIFLAVVLDFPPGTTFSRFYPTEWDDLDAGQYRISSTCVKGDWQTEYTVEIDFLLYDPLDTDKVPLGSLKSRYR